MQRTIDPAAIPQHRVWQGRTLLPSEAMLMFHDRSGPVHETLRKLRATLDVAGIDHVVIGAFALSCYRYERATRDVDLCLRPADLERFRNEYVGTHYQQIQGRARRYYDPQTQVEFDLLISGELAGRTSRNKTIRFPDPAEAVEVAGIRTVTLPRLIELKLVTWRFKDWADVIELIRANNLAEEFADQINPLVRMAYLECFDQKVEEDRYEQETGGH